MRNKIIFLILLIIIIFTRFYNLDKTARFIWDESMDLVNVHQLYIHPKLTLIGPMPENGVKVFSSLTYYLFLPFTIFFKFDPISTAYATAFFGVLTVLLFYNVLRIFHKLHFLNLILPIIFLPLLISSRWAWNPHFIPFWQVIGFTLLFSKLPYKNFLSGVIFGLTIHQHWYSVFSCLGIIFVIYNFSPKFKSIYSYLFGLFIAITPFIIFDITHPPGLFITRLLYFSPVSPGNINNNIINKLTTLPVSFSSYFFNSPTLLLSILLLILTILCIFKYKFSYKILLIPVLFQIIGLSFIGGDTYEHYYLPGAIPFLLFICLNISKFSAKIIAIIIIFLSIININKTFIQTGWTNNITATKQIVNLISTTTNTGVFNIAVLSSPDPNTKGRRYRDLLNIKGIPVQSPDNYSNINTLYVISYENNWNKLKLDPAYELDSFRELTPQKQISIPNSEWNIYQISK